MKLLAVAIAVPFASGMARALHPSVARHAPSLVFLSLVSLPYPCSGVYAFSEWIVTGPYTF